MLHVAFMTLANMNLHALQNATAGINNVVMITGANAHTVTAQQQSIQQHQDQTRRTPECKHNLHQNTEEHTIRLCSHPM